MTETVYLQPQALIGKLEIKPGYHVGDFGVGGSATFALPLGRATGAEGEIYLFDILKTALSSALGVMKLNGLANCKAVWCNLELYESAHGVGKSTLDAGVLINVLHQTKKPKDMLAEIHRMLKPGSRLLIVDWDPATHAPFAPERPDRTSAEHVTALTRSLGFTPIETFQAGPHHWGVVVAKT